MNLVLYVIYLLASALYFYSQNMSHLGNFYLSIYTVIQITIDQLLIHQARR